MTKFASKFVKHLPLAGLSILAALTACLMLWVIPGSRAGQKGGGPRSIGALSPYIDTHAHFDEKNPEGSVQAVLKAERVERAAKIYLQIPPYSFDAPTKYKAEVIVPAAKKYADKSGVLGGGGSLNPMIMEAVSTGKAGADVQK